ncbi:MAG: hypothetical protein L7S64_08745 [Longimicrobiales bacterium]|jgi:hypothetical protein|nr:hypothetical protein [Longimicrobiales bacterium]
MVRTIAGILAGVVVLGLVVTVLQQAGSSMYPLPPGLDPMDEGDAAAFAEHVAGIPALVWLLTVFSEVLGAAAGALVAGLIARDALRVVSGVVVGLATIGSVINWLAFPHPIWFIAAQLVLYPAVLVMVWAVLSPRGATGSVAIED